MTSNKIQELIFENKEEIPNGIYKQLQDLLKIKHEEEKHKGLFEVKYIKIRNNCYIERGVYEDLYDFVKVDEEDVKPSDMFNMIQVKFHHTYKLTKICKLKDASNHKEVWFQDNCITKDMYKNYLENSIYSIDDESLMDVEASKGVKKLKSIKVYNIIYDIKPYKP